MKRQERRMLQIESLEARELLAVSILSAPITAYAQNDNPAEIRIDISNESQSQLEFVVNQTAGSLLDPSAVHIFDNAGKAVALSNVVNGTKSSSATAALKSGIYTVQIASDNGKGNLTLDILQDTAPVAKSGLDILVAAAISQQNSPSNWAGRAAYFNSQLVGTAYAGAASALPISKVHTEVDVNGDGKIDTNDLTLAGQNIAAPKSASVRSVNVAPQDLTAPTIMLQLKQGQPGGTIDPTIIGSISDSSGIKTAVYQIDGGTWNTLTLNGKGEFTLLNAGLGFGKHNLAVKAADSKGNTLEKSFVFTTEAHVLSFAPEKQPIVLTEKEGGKIIDLSPTVNGNGFGESTITAIAGHAVTKNQTLTLASGASVTYLGGLKIQYQSNGQYAHLSEGVAVQESFALTVSDGVLNSSAPFNITITGTHTPIQLLSLNTVTLPPLNINQLPNGIIGEAIRVSKDSDDTLLFSVSAVDSRGKTQDGFYVENETLKIRSDALASLNLNETYTATVQIKNSGFADTVLSVNYTLNFVKRSKPLAHGSSLTINENNVSKSVALSLTDTADGLPIDGQAGFAYSVQLVSVPADVSLSEGVDYHIVDGVFTFLTNGKFDYLPAAASELLTFRYKLTDTKQGNGGCFSEGIITVEIIGQNNAPELTANQETLHLTNSGTASGETIPAGVKFVVSDPDRGDIATLKIRNVSGTKNGVQLAAVPNFSLDNEGNLSLTNTNLDLQPGEAAVFSVEVIASDKAGATEIQTVSVFVHAKQNPILSVNVDNTTITESADAIHKDWAVEVSDPTEEFFDKRNGNTWYSKPQISAVYPAKYYAALPNAAEYFSIVGNETAGYSLSFNAPAGALSFLQEGESFGITLMLSIADKEFKVSASETLNFTISGKGDQHSVSVGQDTFDFWANKRKQTGMSSLVFQPHYTISDADANEEYTFSLVKPDSLLDFNSDGTFSLNAAALAAITQNTTVKPVVRITSISDGRFADIPLSLNIRFGEAPQVSNLELTTNEDTAASQMITVSKPDDGAERPADWAEISAPVYAGYFGTIPHNKNIAEIADSILVLDGNSFTVQPGGQFDYLQQGETVKLFYTLTVSDKTYATSAVETLTVVITGVNDAPVFPANEHFDISISDHQNSGEFIVAVSVGRITFSDVDNALTDYIFTIDHSTLDGLMLAPQNPTEVYLIHAAQPEGEYTFSITARLKTDSTVSFKMTKTINLLWTLGEELPSALELTV